MWSKLQSNVFPGTVLLVSLINLVLIAHRLEIFSKFLKASTYSKQCSRRAASATKYTVAYTGNDFPEYLPLNRPLSLVDRVFDNYTADFPIHGPDAESAWMSIYPEGFGFVRLGLERRILCVSMFHQLHCVDKMRRALDNPDDPVATIPHLQHCMNYIRQMVLCASDLTLEPEEYNPVTESRDATGVGVTHTCHDWSAVYDTINDNYAQWIEYWDVVKESVPNF